jgi:hypothetical protein
MDRLYNLHFHAPNRKHHLPYVLHVLIQDSIDDVVQLIDGDLERV